MHLEIRPSPIHGSGVFLTHACPADVVLETCPVLVLEPGEFEALAATRLGDYVFDWGDGRAGLAMGFTSLCNHDERPNARVEIQFDPPVAHLLTSTALAADEEVLIDYGPAAPV